MDTEARNSSAKRKGFMGRARSFFGSIFACTKTPVVHEGMAPEDETFGPRKTNAMGALPPIQDIEVDDPSHSQHRESFSHSEQDFNNYEAHGHEKPREEATSQSADSCSANLVDASKEEEGGDLMVPANRQLHLEKAGSKCEITEEITMVRKEA